MNHRTRYVTPLILVASALIGLTALLLPNVAQAGIYDASSPVTYKEYWIPHTEFDGGCPPDGDQWYVEPSSGNCDRTLDFEIPDNFSGALKAEIFIDLWRNHDEKTLRFRLNNGELRKPNVGFDWSRSPYIGEVPLTELNQGTNTIYLTGDGSQRRLHVHDIAIRIYYDAGHPLLPGLNSDVTPPTGSLTTIEANNQTFNPAAGGVLNVDSNQIKLTAVVTGATLVEFHAFYEGYDLDTDGVFREWQNRTRHNCNPGGSTVGNGCNGPTPAVGGTIDHIGTTGSAGSFSNCSWNGGTNTATCTWDLQHVINQSGVRFKIRALDAAGNVIDAAGGDSADFTLFRNHPTAAFINPNFESFALNADGEEPKTNSTKVTLPSNVAQYEKVYLLGSYYGNPIIMMNGKTERPFIQGTDDFWMLSIKDLNPNRIYGGNNEIGYEWATANSFGQFIETPGPMIVLRGTTDGFVDSAAPVVTEFAPADGSVDVDPDVPVTFNLEDGFGVGVDYTSIQLRINGNLVSPKISGFSNRYAVTYSPNGGFPTSTPIAVAIDAKDLAGNVLQTTYNFTTEPPDFTPPVISGVSLIPNAKRLTVRWNTDELADSSFDFGVTTSYTRTVSDANLTTAHELIITDLTPSTTYHYRIRSADKDGNGASTLDATFTTPALADLVSDDFNYCSDNDPRWDKWQFVDPLGDATYSLDGETLTISVPGDVEHNVWKDGTPLIRAPHLLQDASDPKYMQVAFLSHVTTAIQQQGLLLIQDAENFVRVNFQYQAGAVNTVIVRAHDGNTRTTKTKVVPDGTSSAPLYLRVVRDEVDRWKVFFSRDGAQWESVDTFFDSYTINKVGIYAGNATEGGNTPAFDMVVDYFLNELDPIANEDGVAQNLPVSANPADKGSVTKSAECGNPVTLTATPVSGWRFAGWSGAASGTQNPISVNYTFGDFVIANFEEERYTLTLNAVGQGGVNPSPLQDSYLYTDSVTLTATPEVGWHFAGWSGDLTGTQNPATLLMHGNKVVTATFTQDQYALTVNVSDPLAGSVVVTPTQDTYVYGTAVALEATANPGWRFVGWSGDATGATNPLTLTMIGNTSITALFEADAYTLAVDTDGSGEVTYAPQQDTYFYGEEITFTATTTEPGWLFERWRGDLTGTANPATLTATGDMSVTAVFTRTQHTVQTGVTSGNGTIVLTPTKTMYFYGEQVTVEAVPDEGWTLESWSGDLSGRETPVTITIDGNKSIAATFVEASVRLTTTVTGQGEIQRNPNLQSFKEGDVVTLTAVPAAGWAFNGWSGAVAGNTTPIQVTMDSDKTVSATFVPLAYTIGVNVASTVNGTDAVSNTVSLTPNLTEYTFGDNVTLTPVAAPGWTFARWEGDLTGTQNPGQLEVTGAMSVTAYFTPTLYTVSFSVGGQGEGGHIETYVNGEANNGPYTHGQQVTLKAVADPGYVFENWAITGPLAAGTTADETELTVTVPDDRSFQARFVRAQQQIFLPLITR